MFVSVLIALECEIVVSGDDNFVFIGKRLEEGSEVIELFGF